MVVLAHIKEQSPLSLGSYGRPRMTEELKEVGVDVGHCRVGRIREKNSPVDCFLILLTFFRTIKAGSIWRRSRDTRRTVETALGHSFEPMAVMPSLRYITRFDNPRRRHSASEGKCPLALERQAA
jgi:hypothetical protein